MKLSDVNCESKLQDRSSIPAQSNRRGWIKNILRVYVYPETNGGGKSMWLPVVKREKDRGGGRKKTIWIIRACDITGSLAGWFVPKAQCYHDRGQCRYKLLANANLIITVHALSVQTRRGDLHPSSRYPHARARMLSTNFLYSGFLVNQPLLFYSINIVFEIFNLTVKI